jgi:hypothetical protein
MDRRAAYVGVALIGCAARSLPNAELVRAEGTISAAAAIGAGTRARAAQHLELAKKGVEEAKTLARDGKVREARLVLQGAQADAELGLMLVRAEKARDEARHEVEEAAKAAATVSSKEP